MKQRKTIVFAAATLLILLPLAAIAAPGDRHGRGPGRGMFPPPGYLDLTDEQVEAAEAIRAETREQVGALREETGTLREALKATLDGDNPDAAAVGEMVIELHGFRQQTRSILQDAESQFAALLTDEQLEKWENFKELRKGRRGFGRRGAHGGFGAGFGSGPEAPGPFG